MSRNYKCYLQKRWQRIRSYNYFIYFTCYNIRRSNLLLREALSFFYIFLKYEHNNNGDFMFYYINIFLLCSFLGFCMETFLKTFVFTSMNNGILYGPWVPVYGLGAVIIIIIMRFIFNRIKVPRWVKWIILFVSVVVLLTLLEFLGGVLIEAIFGKVFWDYSNLKFNIGHYIALEISLLWGVFSFIFIYLIKPLEDKLIKKTPKWLTILVFLIFLGDVVATFLLK